MKKANLPKKTCPVCNKPFTWRKKWRLNWEKVKYCSKKYAEQGVEQDNVGGEHDPVDQFLCTGIEVIIIPFEKGFQYKTGLGCGSLAVIKTLTTLFTGTTILSHTSSPRSIK